MELFVYLRMGGEREYVVVRLLEKHGKKLAQLLSKFEADKAQCFLDGVRQKLLAVIEASFGTFAPFNKIVRGIFRDKLLVPAGDDQSA